MLILTCVGKADVSIVDKVDLQTSALKGLFFIGAEPSSTAQCCRSVNWKRLGAYQRSYAMSV